MFVFVYKCCLIYMFYVLMFYSELLVRSMIIYGSSATSSLDSDGSYDESSESSSSISEPSASNTESSRNKGTTLVSGTCSVT